MIRIALMFALVSTGAMAFDDDNPYALPSGIAQKPVHIPQTYEMRNEDYSDIERNAALNQIENDLRAANTMRLYGIR